MKAICIFLILPLLVLLPQMSLAQEEATPQQNTTDYVPPWNSTLNEIGNYFSEPDWHVDDPQKKVPYFELVVSPTMALAGGFLLWWPPEDFQEFHTEDEPTFQCAEEKTGCADKVGHAFFNSMTVDFLFRHLNTTMERSRALNYSLAIGVITSTVIEIGDGFHSFGASWGDLVANIAGTSFGYMRRKLYLEEHIAFKYTYRASPGIKEDEDPVEFYGFKSQDWFQDYTGHTGRIQFTPSAWIPSLSHHFDWWVPEVFYNTRGYKPREPLRSNRNARSRNLGIGFSFNFPKLLKMINAPNGLVVFFDYFQPTCTTFGTYQNQDRPQDGWSPVEFHCGELAFSTKF